MVVLYGDDENTITDEAILPSNVHRFVMMSVVSLESCGVSCLVDRNYRTIFVSMQHTTEFYQRELGGPRNFVS
jgi:hypothetical protein